MDKAAPKIGSKDVFILFIIIIIIIVIIIFTNEWS